MDIVKVIECIDRSIRLAVLQGKRIPPNHLWCKPCQALINQQPAPPSAEKGGDHE